MRAMLIQTWKPKPNFVNKFNKIYNLMQKF